ncbi:MAG: ABC transporter ATP-binding protein [Vulcanimicrobiaceae bacterium]
MTPVLAVEAVDAGYGASRVLFGVSLHVDAGESVALVGRNGMGKTTMIRTIVGLCRATSGRIAFNGRDMTSAPPHRIARAGVGLVPEGRQIFPTLTVRENLLATAANYGALEPPWTLADVLRLFPRLAHRIDAFGSGLSGGEQQMLAIGRALLLGPRLLILDEATEGLAPVVREEIWTCLRQLRSRGQSILIVDKHLTAVAAVTERAVILQKGRAVWEGPSVELARDPSLHDRFLSV